MISKILRIRRHKKHEDTSYMEDYDYKTDNDDATIATALMTLPVTWEHSCLQKKCGGCAMVINKHPALACDTYLRDIKSKVITIEPLSKFPVVEDLMVDRSSMMTDLVSASAWLEEEAESNDEELIYEASKCLQCGLCLEVCPNYCTDGSFKGMAMATPLSKLIHLSENESENKRLLRSYKVAVYRGCGKSLACRDICPAGIDIDRLLVKSNRKRMEF